MNKNVNDKYAEYTENSRDIVVFVKKITQEHTRELENIMKYVDKKCIVSENGLRVDLTYSELEMLAIKIPALCMNLQIKLNDFSVKSNITELLTDAVVIERLESLKAEKGEAREKMKRAEAHSVDDKIVDAIDKQICQNFKDVIIRADRVYEGIKKVIDGRMRENEYNRKSQQFI